MTNLTHCASASSQIAGTSICHTCTSCDSNGYRVVSGKCTAYACSDYGASYATTPTVASCARYEEKPAGDGICYRCAACLPGYDLNSSGGCDYVPCEVGRIYYSDGTCSGKYDSSRTVIGVVAGEGIIISYQDDWTGVDQATAISRCNNLTRGGLRGHLLTLDEGLPMMHTHFSTINAGLAKITGGSKLGTYTPYWTSSVEDFSTKYGDALYLQNQKANFTCSKTKPQYCYELSLKTGTTCSECNIGSQTMRVRCVFYF